MYVHVCTYGVVVEFVMAANSCTQSKENLCPIHVSYIHVSCIKTTLNRFQYSGIIVSTLPLLQEDLLSFIDVRTLKIKHEEQFKYEVSG